MSWLMLTVYRETNETEILIFYVLLFQPITKQFFLFKLVCYFLIGWNSCNVLKFMFYWLSGKLLYASMPAHSLEFFIGYL